MIEPGPTPTYGVTASTWKPICAAGSDLSQAMNALRLHHDAELEALAQAAARLAADSAALGLPFADGRPISEHLARLEGIASELRARRYQLLEQLEAVRDPLVDLMDESNALLPERAGRFRFVEPRPPLEAPKPLTAVELTPVDRLRLLLQVLAWTQELSRALAVQAMGPTYLLSKVIEHPTSEALALRANLETLGEALRQFILG